MWLYQFGKPRIRGCRHVLEQRHLDGCLGHQWASGTARNARHRDRSSRCARRGASVRKSIPAISRRDSKRLRLASCRGRCRGSRSARVALPAQQGGLDAQYNQFLQDNNLVGNAGIAVGQQAAKALHTQYRPLVAFPSFVGGTEPGQWRPTPSYIGNPPAPPPFAPMAFVFSPRRSLSP